MRLAIFIISICFTLKLVSQVCPNSENIVLRTQSQVDEFPSKYGACDSVGNLRILFSSVNNVDSLIQIIHIDTLEMIGNGYIDNKGFKNLKSVNRGRFSITSETDTFYALERVKDLWVGFPDDDDNLDLSVFSNIKHIESRITTNIRGKLTGLGDFTSGDEFRLQILNNSSEYTKPISNLLPKNPTKIALLRFQNTKNILIDTLNQIKEIQRIFFQSIKDCDISKLEEIKCTEDLEIFRLKTDHNTRFGRAFIKTDTLNTLRIHENDFDLDLYDLTPNLRHINSFIEISENKNDFRLGFFSNFDLPMDIKSQGFIISVTDNPNISSCNNPFLCKALKVYPERVELINNNSNCTEESVMEYCLLSNTSTTTVKVKVYPNPFDNHLYISNLSLSGTSYTLDVIDTHGKIMPITLTEGNNNYTIEFDDIPAGMYTIVFRVDGEVIHKDRVIKI